MKRYAVAAVTAVLALLGLIGFAPSAQAAQSVYPVPVLHLNLSVQTVVSGGHFTATATADIQCDTITLTWNGQTASDSGSTVTHRFRAPKVTKKTVIPITAVCTYTQVSGTSGEAISATTQSVSASANVTVIPAASSTTSGLPNTGGPNVAWYIAGGAAVVLGLAAMLFGRRRRTSDAAL